MDILIPEELAVTGLMDLTERFTVVHEKALWKDPEKLGSVIRDARTLMVRNHTQVTAELLACAPHLIGVGRLGVGLDNIDVEAASKSGIVVVAPIDANATSVAELTLGLMLALARKIPEADRSTNAGGWDRKGCMGVELDGKTICICGFGRIGNRVAIRARAFGMKVVVFDPFIPRDSSAFAASQVTVCERLQDALSGADFVTIHTPLTEATRGMFNMEAFAATKQGAYFVNTSRGGIVNEEDLLKALLSGHLAGVALDVREVEPPKSPCGFQDLNNVILLPHIAAATIEAQTRTFETVAADLDRLLRGIPAVNFINFAEPRRAL